MINRNFKIKIMALYWAIKYHIPHSLWMLWTQIKIERNGFKSTYYRFQTAQYNDWIRKMNKNYKISLDAE